MKYNKKEIHCKAHGQPAIRFEDQSLTSFSGLFIFQRLFSKLGLKEKLRDCLIPQKDGSQYGFGQVVYQLIVHLILGYRSLRESRYYREDPMLKRVLGVVRLPDVGTISRILAKADGRTVERLRRICRKLVLDRIIILGLTRLTLDFDGSVISTMRRAEGTAVGYNRKKKGARSYYPCFCTIAQTGQILDIMPRSGNVHDSNGAVWFVLSCLKEVWGGIPGVKVEVRMDGAFFSDEIVTLLDRFGVEFTISVPFERFPVLKGMIEGRQSWKRFDPHLSFFESSWKPISWSARYRFVFIKKRVKLQHKEPVQLDLFIPYEYGCDYKVIVTNKQCRLKKVLAFHNGRGSQEGVFAELKSQSQMDYVPFRSWVANQIYLLCSVLAHNLGRELQMSVRTKDNRTTEKRSALWNFLQLDTLRRTLIQRAGRFTIPKGQLTLTISANETVQKEFLHYINALSKAA